MANEWDEGSISHADKEGIEELFLGRSITAATETTLTLDNGKTLTIHGNEGCGGCGEGWYEISKLATFPNIITAVEVKDEEEESYSGNVRMFVYSEGIGAEVITAEGSDNGYYGTGFWIEINTTKEEG
ncbi:hypothetical protein [Pseudarthrobacter sp. PS3-L1]|uniref:DUF7448 domain-containing protein n=1 Tax=Pseudarthrobacter sp. PS3-L1 TaxID=3046207 RepID=UPI0024B8D1BA|nr:hypothetical protein [Pseudarthrobacter sp. PS3-L1]MDJ0321681.1 hypothetical protein [Pseudarthrobacter sp. PS3-L1]